MSEPPFPPGPAERPQDTPRFPTYGRPDQPVRQQSPYDRPASADAPFAPPWPSYQGQQPQTPPSYPAAYGPPPAPYGYGYGYPGTPQNKTNGMAVAALVCGLVGILFGAAGPVAVGLGIAALVQIRRRRQNGIAQNGTAQAVIGLVLGSLQTVFWVASSRSSSRPAGTAPTRTARPFRRTRRRPHCRRRTSTI